MSYSQFVNDLKELKIKKKGRRPKVSPYKFYPSAAELEAQEAILDELKDYSRRLESAANGGSVDAVYGVPGATPESFSTKAYDIAQKVSQFNMLAFADFSSLVVGERYFPSQDNKNQILQTWTDNFVNLCKSTNEEMRKKVAGVVSDGVLSGRNLREMIKEVQNTCKDFSRNKAELIATTEVGKLNSAIARNQSESAGIEYYEWSAAMDGRTRESHAVMDGKICKWGDEKHYWEWVEGKDGKRELKQRDRPASAYKGAPGTDFRCRCVALPYVPEYEDDYVREEGPVRGVVQGNNADPETIKRNKEIADLKRKKELLKSQKKSKTVAIQILEYRKKHNDKLSTNLLKPPPPYDVGGEYTLCDEASLKQARTNKTEKIKFIDQLEMARLLEMQEWLPSIFIGETAPDGEKNPDAVIDGKLAEYKKVKPTSKPDAVSEHIKKSLEQNTKIIVLNVLADFDYSTVLGQIKSKLRNKSGMTVYFKLKGKDRLYVHRT